MGEKKVIITEDIFKQQSRIELELKNKKFFYSQPNIQQVQRSINFENENKNTGLERDTILTLTKTKHR